jgi:5-methylthioadenosine/S-adenosylhomocysteine deaminase
METMTPSASPRPIDLLICPRWIIPIEPREVVLEQHALAVDDGKIVDLLPQAEAVNRYAPRQRRDLPGHVLMPGLVNLHTHAAMTLLRGYADDLPLMRWLQEEIWPAEAKHVSPAFVRDGTLLAAAEMLRGGITCCNDMYFFPEAAVEAFQQVGMRATVGLIVIEFPTAYAHDPDDYLAKGLAVRDRHRDNPLVQFSLAPHAPYSVSDRSFERVATLAAQLDAPIHIHVHETRDEISEGLEKHGARPLERLRRLGLLGPGTIAVHAVHLETSEIDLLARHGCSVAHCPTSNMKLASGSAPIAALLDAGVRVGLGSDGAASNNRLDLFQEMRHAALLGKLASNDAAALDVHRLLAIATLEGAKALGLDHRIGSLLPGKEADLCAVKLDDWNLQPCYDPASHLVYVAGREHVTDVWVAGKPLVTESQLCDTHVSALIGTAALWQNAIRP